MPWDGEERRCAMVPLKHSLGFCIVYMDTYMNEYIPNGRHLLKVLVDGSEVFWQGCLGKILDRSS